MKMDELPRAVWWTAFGVMPVIIAIGLLLAVTFISSLSVESEAPFRAVFVALAIYLLAAAIRTTMSCIDWLEARAAKKAERRG